jgi:hypothetical protein
MDMWRRRWIETKDNAIVDLRVFNIGRDLGEKRAIELTFAMASASSPYMIGVTATSLRASISPPEGSV